MLIPLCFCWNICSTKFIPTTNCLECFPWLKLYQIICIHLNACHVGPPSAPNISITGNNDFKSFKVAIDPSTYSALCVKKYNLTIIENGLILRTMTIDSNGTGNVGELNLCKNTYNFTAFAMANNSSSNHSETVAGKVDLSGKFIYCICTLSD